MYQGETEQVKRLPKPPATLGALGKLEWDRAGKFLVARSTLTKLDLAIFEAYCIQYEILQRVATDLKELPLAYEDDKGAIVKNPLLTVYNQAQSALKGLCVELGMTPASREKALTAKNQEPKKDGMKGLLSK